ncbi:MAG TPA: HTTM domain-containing protein [bacterium]|nr:HTTM domain-containing protein [bacterium]
MSLNTFFHEPRDGGRTYVWLRIAFGLTAVLWLLSLHPFLGFFYGAEGLCPPERFALPAWAVTAAWWGTLAAVVFAAAGRFYCPSSVVQFLGIVFFFRTPCRPDNYGDQIFASLAFLMMFLPRSPGDASPWLHKTLRLYAGTLYLVPLLYRLGGAQWWDGTAAWTALADPSTSRVWLLLSRNPWSLPDWVYAAITYASLAFEGLFPFLIWIRRLRLPIVIAGVIFHVAMGSVLDLGLFPLQMIVVLIGCLDDGSISRARASAGSP